MFRLPVGPAVPAGLPLARHSRPYVSWINPLWGLRRMPRAITITYEQAVYGNFAFWDQGYAVLARSPGCRPEWLAEFLNACQNLGERPAGLAEHPGLFALRLASGPWAVVGFRPQGCDDRGRPGALAFHGLFLTPREYRKADCNPFALAGALRDDWSAATQTLPSGTWELHEPEEEGEPDPQAPTITLALMTGRQVAIEASEPIERLARQVWRSLPVRFRARLSVATWTFGNGNRFDLLATPRLAALALDPSYLDPRAAILVGERSTIWRWPWRRSPGPWVALVLVVALALAAVALALRGGDDAEIPAPVVVKPTPTPTPKPRPAPIPPAPPSFAHVPSAAGPEERRRVAEALMVLAERFGVKGVAEASSDPGLLMERIARELRYRGPFLSEADRDELSRDPSRDAPLALRWDALVRQFADDRPLPDGFRRGPLGWQLGVFAWSFHRETDPALDPASPGRSPAEVAQALAESLTVDVPLRPTPLSSRYPALSSYLAFLAKLPRR